MHVNLQIPEGMAYQLVYRVESRDHAPVSFPPGVAFHWVDRVAPLLRHWRLWAGALGAPGTVKACLKILAGRRALYGVAHGGVLGHFGWVTLSRCRHYHIEPYAAVVGPVMTLEAHRGRGLATLGLRSVRQCLLARGWPVVYIDTGGDNLAMQTVIARCGFGAPVGVYPRPEQRLALRKQS